MGYSQTLVFTDLDGTLLDHDSYQPGPAGPLLNRLGKQQVPVIPCSSKTAAEIMPLMAELNLHGPFICENGAAVYIPTQYFAAPPAQTQKTDNHWVKQFSPPRAFWLAVLHQLHSEFPDCFASFAEMGAEKVASQTGLSLTQARLACNRHWSEPVQWLGSEQAKKCFIARLKEQGANPLQGGRFLSVSGECDKGQAMKWLAEQYAKFHPDAEVRTLALGDGENDIAMLEAADLAVIIASSHHSPPVIQHSSQRLTSGIGPAGWAEAIEHFFFKHGEA